MEALPRQRVKAQQPVEGETHSTNTSLITKFNNNSALPPVQTSDTKKSVIPRRGHISAITSNSGSNSNSNSNNSSSSSSYNNNNNNNNSNNSISSISSSGVGALTPGGGSGGGNNSSSVAVGAKRKADDAVEDYFDKDKDKWILVLGLASTANQHTILTHFNNFGAISEYNTGRPGANWVFIKYSMSAYARKAAQNTLQQVAASSSSAPIAFSVHLYDSIKNDPALKSFLLNSVKSDNDFESNILKKEESEFQNLTATDQVAKKYKSSNVVSIDNYLQPRPKQSFLGDFFDWLFN